MTASVFAPPPDWTASALCAQVDPEVWFPEKGEKNADAKRICARCEVREQCLAYAIAHGELRDALTWFLDNCDEGES